MRQLLTIPVAAAILLSSCSTAFQQPQGSFHLNVEFPMIATSFTTMVIPSETDKIKVQLKTADDQTMERELTRSNPRLRVDALPLGDTEVKAQAFKGSEMLARGATKVTILPGLNTAELELEVLDEKEPPPANTTTGSDISVDLGGSRAPTTPGDSGPPAGPTPGGDGSPTTPGDGGPPAGPAVGDPVLGNEDPALTTGVGLPVANTSGAGDSVISPRGVTGAGLAGPAATTTLDPPTLSGAGYPVKIMVNTPDASLTYHWSCDSHCGTFSSPSGTSTIFHTPTSAGTSVVRLKEIDASGNFRESTINIVVPGGTGSINLNQGVVG